MVFHHHGLAQHFAQAVAQLAPDHVRATARGHRHDVFDGAIGVGRLRAGQARQAHQQRGGLYQGTSFHVVSSGVVEICSVLGMLRVKRW